MKYWFDTEFVEKPCTIDLISIAVVAEDSRTFYAESTEVDWAQASPWVLDNVRPHLSFDYLDRHRTFTEAGETTEMAAPRNEIGAALLRWANDPSPEFWAYYADYDWVALCWLHGTMMDLPQGWPMFCRDVKQLADMLGNPRLPKQESTEHHALSDALWTRDAWHFLNGLSDQRPITPASREQA